MLRLNNSDDGERLTNDCQMMKDDGVAYKVWTKNLELVN